MAQITVTIGKRTVQAFIKRGMYTRISNGPNGKFISRFSAGETPTADKNMPGRGIIAASLTQELTTLSHLHAQENGLDLEHSFINAPEVVEFCEHDRAIKDLIQQEAARSMGSIRTPRKALTSAANIGKANAARIPKACNCGQDPHKSNCPAYARQKQAESRARRSQG